MLSLIASEHFRASPFLGLGVGALLVFFAVFVAVTVRMVLSRESEIEVLARLPLEADDE